MPHPTPAHVPTSIYCPCASDSRAEPGWQAGATLRRSPARICAPIRREWPGTGFGERPVPAERPGSPAFRVIFVTVARPHPCFLREHGQVGDAGCIPSPMTFRDASGAKGCSPRGPIRIESAPSAASRTARAGSRRTAACRFSGSDGSRRPSSRAWDEDAADGRVRAGRGGRVPIPGPSSRGYGAASGTVLDRAGHGTLVTGPDMLGCVISIASRCAASRGF